MLRAFVISWLLVVLSTGGLSAQDVVPVKEGEAAPHAGLLVKEARFTKMLEAELAVPDLQGRLKIQEGLTSKLELVYTTKLEEAVKPLPWYQTPEFNRWLGFFIGVAVTGFAIWGGSELVKAVK
jgi:hypothetical protein